MINGHILINFNYDGHCVVVCLMSEKKRLKVSPYLYSVHVYHSYLFLKIILINFPIS